MHRSRLLPAILIALILPVLLGACAAPPANEPTTTAPEATQPPTLPVATLSVATDAPPDPTVLSTPTEVAATVEPAATEAAPAGDALPERVTDAHSVEMVLIPAGEFLMGSEDGLPDEQPMHSVLLDAFYIDLNETTNAEYRACVEAGACDPPDYDDCCASPGTQWVSRYPDYFSNPEFDEYPVTWLSWEHASEYCAWRGARLPTEAEWEKAARGTDGRLFPWGNEPPTPELANYIWYEGQFDGRPAFGTVSVGSYPAGASPYGVLDMAGSVYEWVQDLYDDDYYAYAPTANPQGPTDEDGSWQIARGGSFWNKPERLRIPNRNHAYLPPDVGHFDAGVRCAADAPLQ